MLGHCWYNYPEGTPHKPSGTTFDHNSQGMQIIIRWFYYAIAGWEKCPVTKEESLMVIENMDKTWHHIEYGTLNFEPVIPAENHAGGEKGIRILVTGATGFLGSRLVKLLVQRGYRVRALARKLSNIDKIKQLGIEIFFGDVGSKASIKPAFEGIDIVVHAAADTSGNKEAGEHSTVLGTTNIIDLCSAYKIKKLVYISSCNVYGVADYKKGALVTEKSSLERFPERRGYYSDAKFQADQAIVNAIKKNQLSIVTLRPGMIFGPGGEVYTPMMGFSLGTRLFGIIGDGEFVLPLVYIDNLVDAIIAAIEKKESGGKIYNVVDSDCLTKKQYVESLIKKLYPNAKCIYIPYSLFYLTVFMQEILIRVIKRKPFLTRYRLVSSQKNILYDSTKIQRDLNWNPPVTTQEAIYNVIQYEKKGRNNKINNNAT